MVLLSTVHMSVVIVRTLISIKITNSKTNLLKLETDAGCKQLPSETIFPSKREISANMFIVHNFEKSRNIESKPSKTCIRLIGTPKNPANILRCTV